MAKRRLTASQAAILNCMAQNGGRAIICTGYRWPQFYPGKAFIFGQALGGLLQNRWITSKDENERHSFVWTDSGRNAHRNGWYVPEQRIVHNLDAKPEPASPEG